ncbi:winged helix-turn-helix transcriptional regulator [Streptomyces sp. NPDC056632]|uniref:winged helix-turn-helix transcriptional regulator n=1 Tax=Streptomyces sp. NPDC056632 TaxID=3345884 RepID=UPI0036C67089
MSEGHTDVTTPVGVGTEAVPDVATPDGTDPGVAAPVVSCADECGVRDVQDRLGDKWTVHVVVELAAGPRRFKELQRLVEGVSQRMLTFTLRRLERDGLVARQVFPTTPPQVEYSLTDTGHSMTHLIRQLVDWSLDHRAVIARSREAFDARHPA